MNYEPRERASLVMPVLAAWVVCGIVAAIALGLASERPSAASDLATGAQGICDPGSYQRLTSDRPPRAAHVPYTRAASAAGTGHSG